MLKNLMICLLAVSAQADFQEVGPDQMDSGSLSLLGREVLQMPGIRWQHAQTERFVYHYERKTFALKAARMAEFLFDHIAKELNAPAQGPAVRSHIFIFRSPKDWQEFIRASGMKEEWAFSVVRGPEMFLQQADGTAESGSVLAHEMTHLVINRLFPRRLPLWLNEGMAEWYEEFGYAAFKGIKKSRRAHFKKRDVLYPLADLFAATQYPAEVEAFYRTSKMLFGWLMLRQPAEKIMPFTLDVMNGMSAEEAFRIHYEMDSADQLQKELEAFLN
ncbi:MAG TPA: hypothetical protein PKK36_03640 [Kiritimatiellia bacterium]|nr:hypothetical protein [Kiritimatiellia bacterium]HPA78141.1 hypothetical protein [Kiritimatiellia bacterium]HQQ03200.1 hypothetical protein [Kiritimatiellia bacterium]